MALKINKCTKDVGLYNLMIKEAAIGGIGKVTRVKSFCLIKYHATKTKGAAVVKLNEFLTLGLDGGDESSCRYRELNLSRGHQARSLVTKLSVIC
jgi:hypothetical protein